MSAAYLADAATVGPEDAMIHVAAFSHASGLMALPFLSRGAAQVLPPSGGFDADELFGLIAAGQRSSFFVPPTLLRRLAAHPAAAGLAPGKIGTILAGAAPIPPADLRAAVAALGPVVWNGYGQGESPCTITANGKAAIGDAVAAGDEDGAGLGRRRPGGARSSASSTRRTASWRRARWGRSSSTARP